MTEELNNDVRKLRFLDENGETYPDWEGTSLGSVGKVISGTGFPEKAQGSLAGEYPFFKVSDMNLLGNEIEMRFANNTITEKVAKEIRAKICREPSIIFAKVGAAVFLERKRKVLKPFLIDNNMMLFSPVIAESLSFYYHIFQKIQLSKLVQTGALPSYNASDVKKINLSIPSLPEQTKIAEFLSNLDERIEAQSKLVELLKKQKQGYSQRLFNGSLRFKKDDGTDYDDWEEKKLGELIDYNSKIKQLSANELEELKNDTNEVRLLPSSKNYNWTTDTETAKRFMTNKEVFTMGRARYANLKYVNGPFISSNNVILSSKDVEKSITKFLMLIVIDNIEEFYVDGTTYPKFSKPNLDNFKINLPSLPEQEKIAAFLTNLDNRIEKETNKLEKLKLAKQGYMQRVLG